MKKYRPILIFLCICAFYGIAHAEDAPRERGWVNDYANVIPVEYRDKITALLLELEEKTGSEVAVVTVDSIAPYDEKAYALMLFDKWKIGKIGKDNGVLMLLAVKERRWRIEVGYGLEGLLTDGTCGEIGRNYMVPYFKEAKYAQGLYYGSAAIADIIANDNKVVLGGLNGIEYKNDGKEIPVIAYILFFGAIFIFNIFSKYSNRGSRYYHDDSYYGGGFGGGGSGGGGFGGFGGGSGGGGGAGGGF